jgi:mycothiol synthase
VSKSAGKTVLRPLREEDAEAVASLYRAAFGDDRPLDAEEIASWFRNPGFRRDRLRVLEANEQLIAGYGDIAVTSDVVELDVAAPGHWETFLNWAEEAARSEGIPRVRVFFPAGHELADVVASRGYHYWRSAYTMEIELGEAPPDTGTPPSGIELRPYADAEAEMLRAALNEVFAGDPFYENATPERFRAFFLGARGFDPSLWLLAWDTHTLVGFVLAYPQRTGDPTVGQVRSLGVRPAWRRKGLGEALLREAFRELHARGLRTIQLGVDAENTTGALGLYERVGMRVLRRQDNWVTDL